MPMNGLALVPRARLLFWFAVIALPFSVLGVVYPEAASISVGCILGLLVVVVWDGARSGGRLEGISIELPPLLRLTQARVAALRVTVRNDSRRGRQLRLGLAWPPPLASPHDECLVVL